MNLRIKPLGGTLLSIGEKVIDAIGKIQESEEKICIVVDSQGSIVGTVTDGDVRRALLRGESIDSPVSAAMHSNPRVVGESDVQRKNVQMSSGTIVVNGARKPIGIIYPQDLPRPQLPNPVLIMAGGKGTRLLPLTKNIPKPLLPIGGVPMIEILISRMAKQGFSNFFVSIAHLGDLIEERLGDGRRLGVKVQFIREDQPLGTAGAIGLIEAEVSEPLVVTNADLITECDFDSMLRFHQKTGAVATIGVREYSHDIPFGVVKLSGTSVLEVSEKPTINTFVSAGIYCISSEGKALVTKGEAINMPDLINKLTEVYAGKIAAFPIHETWDDVGQLPDLERVRSHWGEGE